MSETMNGNTWKFEMAEKLSKLVRMNIYDKDVHSDENGWYYYISAKSLERNHPLIMVHYRGPLFVVIPFEDYAELNSGDVVVDDYIDGAYWNFGYYAGGGSLIDGAFWHPIENEPGIHNSDKVERYLRIRSCLSAKRSSGYRASEKTCRTCPIDNCPMSTHEIKNANADWENEDMGHDYRVNLFHAFVDKWESEMNVKFRGLCSCDDSETVVLVPCMWEADTVSVNFPVNILNSLLYHPGEEDIDEIVRNIKVELKAPISRDTILMDEETMTVPPSEFCRNFWSAFGVTEQWDSLKGAKPETINVTVEVSVPEKEGLFKRIKRFFVGA